MPGQPGGHGIHREVAPGQVVFQRAPVRHDRLARGPVVAITAVGRDLEVGAALAQPDSAEVDADRPDLICPAADHGQDPVGRRVSGEVDIAGLAAEEDIPDRPANEGKLMTGRGEKLAELVGERRDSGEQGGGGLPLGE